MTPNTDQIRQYLQTLQTSITDAITSADGKAKFVVDNWTRESGEGGGKTMVLAGGDVFEQAGVNFSEVTGDSLPVSATAHRPELVGRNFHAMGLSLVVHPNNPHVPTSHANVRFFIAEKAGETAIWWVGGGFDLTPYYAYTEDCVHWHQVAKQACADFGSVTDSDIYSQYKQWCDDYFHLKHRNEARGIGGLFFDDLNQPDFEQSFAFMRSVGDHFLKAYLPIVEKRKDTAFTDQQKKFQLYRRGRYVEFNLVYDRGTLFGLQSGGRTESILMSLPPVVNWQYNYQAEPGSDEALLTDYYLKPRNWINLS